ncbi:Fanconi anemia group I protein-like [Branchiostoma floridae x Branchiostoma japonicum]
MDKKILALSEEGDVDSLTKLLKTLGPNQLEEFIDVRVLRGKGNPTTFLRAVFHGAPCESAEGAAVRVSVYKHVLELLEGGDVSSKMGSELLGFLLMEVEFLPPSAVVELAQVFVDAVKSGNVTNTKSLDLFSKLLSSLASRETVSYGNGNQMTGAECKSHILNSLCSSRWDSSCVIHLAAVFRDIPTTNDELKFVMEKILRSFRHVDLQELPPLVYQLLLLSTKGFKRLVLEGITSYFAEQDQTVKQQESEQSEDMLSSLTADQLCHMEGTIILHITFAIKQDQDLGREFVKFLKAGQQGSLTKILSPFNVALALSVARIQRFEEPIFEFLKSAISRSFKDEQIRQGSKWVTEMVPESSNVTESLLETVKNSSYGWDHVTQGLVQLGFTLMDSFGPKLGPAGRVVESSGGTPKSPTQLACSLGAQILVNTFKVHEMVRSDILEQILNRVVTKATSPVTHYIELLSNTVSTVPQTLLECLPKVRDSFDYLSYLPAASAEGLLKAVQPLLKLSMPLKDTLMLVLRKAMFSRQADARKVAVTGFLMILRHFKVLGGLPCSQSCSQSFSFSQIQVDIHTPPSSAGNEALCLEILGNLRRCLTQQADVRLMLYEGMYDVLSRNPHLGPPILEMLLSQFRRYYEAEDDVTPPLQLDPCITAQGDQTFLVEPLGHLLCSMVQCLLKCQQLASESEEPEDDEALTAIQSELGAILESLTRRMIKCEMEDFELDKSADFSMNSGVGVKNNIFGILVLGLYEVLMEYTCMSDDFSKESCEQLLQLFLNYNKLAETMKEKTAKGKSGGAKVARSLLTIRCTARILQGLFSDDVPQHQEGLSVLRENTDLVRFIVSVAQQKIQQVCDKGHTDGSEGSNKDKLYKYCCNMARVLLRKFTSDLQAHGESGRRSKGKAVSAMCLEGFCTIVNIICSRYPDQVAAFLTQIEPGGDDADEEEEAGTNMDDQERVNFHIKRFQRMVVNMVTSSDDDVSPRDAVQLVNVIALLSCHLSPGSDHLVQLHAWVNRLCTEQNVDDSAMTKALLSLLFSLTAQTSTSLTVLRDLAQDVHSQMGDIDQDVDVEDQTQFAVVNPRTATPVMALVVGQVDRVLEEVDWVIGKMKAELSGGSAAAEDAPSQGPTQREGHEKSVCVRLGTLVTVYHELVQAAIPMGTSVEALLKSLVKLYNNLTLLAKYYLAMYTQKVGHLSPRFEKLVKLSGTHLSQQAYALITYIQAAQNEKLAQRDQHKGKGGKKKDKTSSDAVGQARKAQVLRETKSIPVLVFAIEQYERYLIQLTKKSKVNLMEHMKMSTSRDFRINTAAVQMALQGEEESSSEEEKEGSDHGSDGEAEEQENQGPPAKKAKTAAGKLSKGKGGRAKKGLTESNE